MGLVLAKFGSVDHDTGFPVAFVPLKRSDRVVHNAATDMIQTAAVLLEQQRSNGDIEREIAIGGQPAQAATIQSAWLCFCLLDAFHGRDFRRTCD